MLAAAHVALGNDADLEEGVRVEEDVLDVAVLQSDAQLVRRRAVDVLHAEVIDLAPLLAPGDELAFQVGVLREGARVVL